MLVEAKKEEANEMKDKERRSRNVIIHGVLEQSTNEDFVDSLVKEIRISVNIKRLELQTTTKQDLRNSSLKEVDTVWRVRGNSKNGFFLKKVRKITNQNQISHQ